MSDSDDSGRQAAARESSGVPAGCGCLATFLMALAGAGLLLIVLSVVLRGEARFSKGDLGEIRIWLIRESANQGLAFSTTRIASGSESSGEVCIRTTARFLMTQSEQEIEDVAFCSCFERQGQTWIEVGECPAESP